MESESTDGNILGKKDFKALQPFTWALMGVILVMTSTSFSIWIARPCPLETALKSVYLQYTPHPCKYNAIRNLAVGVFKWGLAEFGWHIFLIMITPRIHLMHTSKKKITKRIIYFTFLVASNVFGIGIMIQWTEVIAALAQDTDVDYGRLQSTMMSELVKNYASDSLNSSDDISIGWNKFFIQYDCCAVREVQGTTNDFDNTPWCTKNGSCQAGVSRIPKSCCKDVTQDDYESAPVSCYASVSPGTYRQSCISRMRDLSVVDVDSSYIATLASCLFALSVYQIMEQFWTCVLNCDAYVKSRNSTSE